MSIKIIHSVILGLYLVPSVICATHPYQKVYKNNNYRRVGWKDHDKGADYSLSTPLYQHINPFYTKKWKNDSSSNSNNEKEVMPMYYPVYNHQNIANNSVQETTAVSNEQPKTGYSYSQPPSNGEKSNGYLPPSTSYGVPDATYTSYGSSNNYGPPSSSYSSSQSSYEIPSSSYGSPSGYTNPNPTYGPPSPTYQSSHYYPNSYNPPPPQYGPPAPPAMMMEPADQKGHEGFLEKLVKKFDLVLASKMILKLIIFKKIIKFIAIICLLMFIPVLKKKFVESTSYSSDDEERTSRNVKLLDSYANVDFRMKEVANFALSAIEAFESHDIRWCVGESEFFCRFQYMLDTIDLRYPGYKMIATWFPALVTTTTTEKPFTKDHKEKVVFNDYITESSIENANEDENLVKK